MTDLVIRLPLPLDTAARLMRAVDREWPGALAVTDHDHGDHVLVLRVDPTDGEAAKQAAMASGDCQCPPDAVSCPHPTCRRIGPAGSRP